MAKAECLGTIWLCECCTMVLANGTHFDGDCREPHEPLSVIGEADITLGMLWSEHDEACPNREANEWVAECDCEIREFSPAWCDGCGSRLAGTRHAATLWKRED
jgi:hypothetical protein